MKYIDRTILEWRDAETELPPTVSGNNSWQCLILIHDEGDRYKIAPGVFHFYMGTWEQTEDWNDLLMSYDTSEVAYWARLPDAIEIK